MLRPTIFMTIAAMLVLAIGMMRGEQSILSYLRLKKSHDILHSAVSKLVTENASMKAEIEKIEGSPRYAQKILRGKYHVTKPGETIIFFAD